MKEKERPLGESSKEYQFATRCARAGGQMRSADETNSPVQASIVQSAIFDLGGTEDAEAIFSGARKGYAYSRFGNPTVDTLAGALADLEGGAQGLVTSSGNAALLCAVTAALQGRSGPIVTHQDIYGGSFELLRILSTVYGLKVESVDSTDESRWFDAVSRAGAVLVESPSNPLMKLIDLRATIALAHAHGADVIIDNTVATPFNQRPFEMGADWVIHSTTKYLNGHADLIGGCLIRREPLSPQHRAIHKNLGGTVNAFEAWLALRGLKTFALRMEAHNRNATAVVDWLQRRPEVERVFYPGLIPDRQTELFRHQMKHGGGLLAFELKGGEVAASAFVNHLKLVVHAVSLGGPETLVTRPAKTSHRGMTPEGRQQAGILDGLIRFSAGLEAIEDIIGDLEQAFTHL